MRVRSTFFSERVVNVWNNLPASVDFKSLSSFKRTVKLVDLSKFLKCFYRLGVMFMFNYQLRQTVNYTPPISMFPSHLNQPSTTTPSPTHIPWYFSMFIPG